MTVAELIEFLKKQPQDMLVGYRVYSEQCLLNVNEIGIRRVSAPRPDGWMQDTRSDLPSIEIVCFPGN